MVTLVYNFVNHLSILVLWNVRSTVMEDNTPGNVDALCHYCIYHHRYSSTGSESSAEENGVATSLSVIHAGPQFFSGTIRSEQGTGLFVVQCYCRCSVFCLEAFTTYSIVQAPPCLHHCTSPPMHAPLYKPPHACTIAQAPPCMQALLCLPYI